MYPLQNDIWVSIPGYRSVSGIQIHLALFDQLHIYRPAQVDKFVQALLEGQAIQRIRNQVFGIFIYIYNDARSDL